MPQVDSTQSSVALIDGLLDTLNTLWPSDTNNTHDTSHVKHTFLTLYTLFPEILLSALDVLDRRLITRLVVTGSEESKEANINTIDGKAKQHTHLDPQTRFVYYVKSSAPPPSSRGRYADRYPSDLMSYEARTVAWNCTCAAFTFSAFNLSSLSERGVHEQSRVVADDQHNNEDFLADGRWGGLSGHGTGRDAPLCKHLLACVLAECWAVAGTMIEERIVGKEEMAGWAAGWGG